MSSEIGYIQSQLNDGIQELSFQLDKHQDLMTNIHPHIRFLQNMTKCPRYLKLSKSSHPFPQYGLVMLILSIVSLFITLVFTIITICLSKRITNWTLLTDSSNRKITTYRPGKYSIHTITFLCLIDPAFVHTNSSYQLIKRFIEHENFKEQHGVLFDFLPYRTSESFFQIFTIYTLSILLFLAFYQYFFTKAHKSPLPPLRHLQYNYLACIFLFSLLPNYVFSLFAFSDDKLGPIPEILPPNWTISRNSTWGAVPFKDLWNISTPSIYTNPGIFFSDTYGIVTAEKTTFTRSHYPLSRYLRNREVSLLEKTCLCQSVESPIYPQLTTDVLFKAVTLAKPTGVRYRLKWEWNEPLKSKHLMLLQR